MAWLVVSWVVGWLIGWLMAQVGCGGWLCYGGADAAYIARVYALSACSCLHVGRQSGQFECAVTWMSMTDGKPGAVLASATCKPQSSLATRRQGSYGIRWLAQQRISQRISTSASERRISLTSACQCAPLP